MKHFFNSGAAHQLHDGEHHALRLPLLRVKLNQALDAARAQQVPQRAGTAIAMQVRLALARFFQVYRHLLHRFEVLVRRHAVRHHRHAVGDVHVVPAPQLLIEQRLRQPCRHGLHKLPGLQPRHRLQQLRCPRQLRRLYLVLGQLKDGKVVRHQLRGFIESALGVHVFHECQQPLELAGVVTLQLQQSLALFLVLKPAPAQLLLYALIKIRRQIGLLKQR